MLINKKAGGWEKYGKDAKRHKLSIIKQTLHGSMVHSIENIVDNSAVTLYGDGWLLESQCPSPPHVCKCWIVFYKWNWHDVVCQYFSKNEKAQGLPWRLSHMGSTCQCGRHGFNPDPGRPHVPRHTSARVLQLLSLHSRAWEPQRLEAGCPGACVHNQRSRSKENQSVLTSQLEAATPLTASRARPTQ